MLDMRYTELSKDGFGCCMTVKETLFSGQSDFQKVDIFDTESMGRVLTLDGLMMTTERDEFYYHEMISHIPMMNHKNPESVLVIGGGDGGTIREVLKHDTVKKCVLCEIDGMVVDACKKYLPTIGCELDNPKVEVKIEDAIEFITKIYNYLRQLHPEVLDKINETHDLKKADRDLIREYIKEYKEEREITD